MKTFLLAIVIAIGLGVTGVILKVVLFPAHTLTKEIQMSYDAVDKTLTADNAIYNYEWFKQTYEDIEAIKRKLEIAQTARDTFKKEAGSRENWTFEDKQESARLSAVAQGIEGQLKDVIAKYNARSKMANRNIFKNGIIPGYIDATTFIFKQ